MMNEKAYIVRIRSETGNEWHLHNVDGKLFETEKQSAAKAAVTKLIKKQKAGGPRCTFEIVTIYY